MPKTISLKQFFSFFQLSNNNHCYLTHSRECFDAFPCVWIVRFGSFLGKEYKQACRCALGEAVEYRFDVGE